MLKPVWEADELYIGTAESNGTWIVNPLLVLRDGSPSQFL